MILTNCSDYQFKLSINSSINELEFELEFENRSLKKFEYNNFLERFKVYIICFKVFFKPVLFAALKWYSHLSKGIWAAMQKLTYSIDNDF